MDSCNAVVTSRKQTCCNDFEESVKQNEASVSLEHQTTILLQLKRKRKRKRKRQWNRQRNTLVRIIFLLFGILTVLFNITDESTLAFALLSRTSSRISPLTKSTRNSCRSHNGCQIRNYEKDCGFGIIQPCGMPKSMRPRALHSTTESANGGITSSGVPNSGMNKAPLPKTNQKPKHNHNNSDPSRKQVPRHVGLICDGNGRWATQRNLPRAVGHLEGARRLVDLIRSLLRERKTHPHDSVDCITLYAFSTENWNRSPQEISKIFEAIEFAAKTVKSSRDLVQVDIRILGDLSDDRIPASLKNVLFELEERTKIRLEGQKKNIKNIVENESNHNRLQVCLAINYGGRRDIVSACRSLAEAVRDGTIEASEITEDSLEQSLTTGGIPPPDLIVRTGGEHRLSNFLLWESAYAEICVSEVLWPDFSLDGEWKKSLDWYSKRKRNFGGRNE